MKIESASATNRDPEAAAAECCAKLTALAEQGISWLGVYYSDTYAGEKIIGRILAELGPVPIHGGTSCMGVMTSAGFASDEGVGMGVLAISDPLGSYGVGSAALGTRPELAAQKALAKALANADRDGEVPALVWMNAAPGSEEQLIQGIESLIGPDVPITGGSTADNAAIGNSRQVSGGEVLRDAVVISVFFPSTNFHYAFHSGYDPTDKRGVVTRAEGRLLMEIDGRPACEVYNEWTEGLIQAEISARGSVLSKTTLAPLGREAGVIGGIPYYKLSHPSEITTEDGLSLFSEVAEGEEIVLMTGSRSSLITRAGRVSSSAISAGGFDPESIIGAIVVYCAGCMLTVREDMHRVTSVIGAAIGNVPFLGIFTFGEQGCFVGNENTHGNLMISVVTFSKTPAY